MALLDKGIRFLRFAWYGSAYGAYYFSYVAHNGMWVIGNGLTFALCSFLMMQVRMAQNLSVAQVTINTEGDSVRLITFKGRDILASIRDIRLLDVKPTLLQFTTQFEGREVKFNIDNNDRLKKMYQDTFLLMAIAHPDVHRVNF